MLVALGVVVVTLGVVGMFRFPDVHTQLHAASKAVFLGVVAFLVASMATGEGPIIARAMLVSVFLVLTTPVGAHAIGKAVFLRGDATETAGALDEPEREEHNGRN